MNSKDLDNVLQITELVAKIGIPMIQSILKTVSEKSPTIEQIHKLRRTIKDPESYFELDGAIKPIGTDFDLEEFGNAGLEKKEAVAEAVAELLKDPRMGVIPSADPVSTETLTGDEDTD